VDSGYRRIVLIGLVAVAFALVATVTIGLVRHTRDGQLRAPSVDHRYGSALRALGVEPAGVTLVHFSTPVCAPCRAVRALCAEAAATVDGVATLEVDVDTHLDAVRALDVWRAPTLLVVDSTGRITLRAVGVPRLSELLGEVRKLAPVREAR
jgi:Thioredoxin